MKRWLGDNSSYLSTLPHEAITLRLEHYDSEHDPEDGRSVNLGENHDSLNYSVSSEVMDHMNNYNDVSSRIHAANELPSFINDGAANKLMHNNSIDRGVYIISDSNAYGNGHHMINSIIHHSMHNGHDTMNINEYLNNYSDILNSGTSFSNLVELFCSIYLRM